MNMEARVESFLWCWPLGVVHSAIEIKHWLFINRDTGQDIEVLQKGYVLCIEFQKALSVYLVL